MAENGNARSAATKYKRRNSVAKAREEKAEPKRARKRQRTVNENATKALNYDGGGLRYFMKTTNDGIGAASPACRRTKS